MIIDEIRLVNFTSLDENDAGEILAWRNDKRIWSFIELEENAHRVPISSEDHQKFIESLHTAPDKLYYLVKHSDYRIGVIALRGITHTEAFFGYYLNPSLIGKSYGVLLEYLVLTLAFQHMEIKTLYCENLKKNRAVIDIHKYFGLTIRREHSDKPVVLMTIDKAAWESQRETMAKLVSRFFMGRALC